MKPLRGITILDISRLIPGGFATLLLSDLGARVIKVEQPGLGDYYRAVLKDDGILGAEHVDAIFQGKESVTLDLKSPEGLRVFRKLVQKVDVVVENFRPGVLKKLKIDYPSLKKIKRSIILCSITGFGQKGARSHLAGHDLNFLGLSGLLSRMKDSSGKLVIPDFQITDLAAGMSAASEILAALFYRQKTKKGSHLDVSLQGAGLSLARLYLSKKKNSSGSSVGGDSLRYGVYLSSDGKPLTLAALEPKFWIRFCQIIKKPEWEALDFGLFTEEQRRELEEIFKTKTQAEWVDLGEREDICLFPVVDVNETGIKPSKPAPVLGAHTKKILRWVQ